MPFPIVLPQDPPQTVNSPAITFDKLFVQRGGYIEAPIRNKTCILKGIFPKDVPKTNWRFSNFYKKF